MLHLFRTIQLELRMTFVSVKICKNDAFFMKYKPSSMPIFFYLGKMGDFLSNNAKTNNTDQTIWAQIAKNTQKKRPNQAEITVLCRLKIQ